MHTPSSYMYSDLRSFGGITNKEAAGVLLTSKHSAATTHPAIESTKEPFYQGRSFTQPQVKFILSISAISIKAHKR